MRVATLTTSLLLLAAPALAGDRVDAADRLVAALSSPTPTVRCLQPLLLEVHGHEDDLPAPLRTALRSRLEPAKVPAATYVSPSGRFELSYVLEGTNAVPAADTDPANGVPDFVERIAVYCDESWAHQVDELGFPAPRVGAGRYPVSFEAMGAYGYTTTSGAVQTRIGLHNTFEGFGPNDDPEGDRWGAAKVTVAHEFKHATQYAGSFWSEGGWLELDATWIEESQYDEVNDYHAWLRSGSPIAEPGLPLDHGGSGSYEDCVWQHYLGQRFGPDLMVDLWEHRATLPVESMVASYHHVLTTRGSSFAEAFCGFTAWNLATGARATADFGYREAAAYPTAPLVADVEILPADLSGAVSGLAADLLRVVPSGRRGLLELRFAREAGSDLRLAALVHTRDGASHLFTWDDPDPVVTLDVPLESIAAVGVAVSNPHAGGEAAHWTLEVHEDLAPARPALALDLPTRGTSLAPGGRATVDVTVGNAGEAGSVLDYRVVAMRLLPPVPAADIAGSRVTLFPSGFVPGSTADFEVVVTNATPDEEWLSRVEIAMPEGVTVVDATPLTGGRDGDLRPRIGAGRVEWIDPDGGFGRIRGQETARATLTLAFAASVPPELTLATRIEGDGWGGGTHSVEDTWILTGPQAPALSLSRVDAYLALGAPVDLAWEATGGIERVRLELSGDGGTTWNSLLADAPATGTWTWTPDGPARRDAILRVADVDGNAVAATTVSLFEPVTWVSIHPDTGALPAGDTRRHGIELDGTDLAAGIHEVDLAVLHDGTGSVRRITVRVEEGAGLPRPLVLAQNAPNPFNPATTLRWRLPQAGPVSLVVYDPAGRHVATLVDTPQPAGEGAVTWNGTDDAGRTVASGVYVYRLTTPEGSRSRRMVLVR